MLDVDHYGFKLPHKYSDSDKQKVSMPEMSDLKTFKAYMECGESEPTRYEQRFGNWIGKNSAKSRFNKYTDKI